MDSYALEYIVEDVLLGALGTSLSGVQVVQGTTDSWDSNGNPIILGESHIAEYVRELIRESPQNFNWTADLVVTVATHQDEELSIGSTIRNTHRDRCLAVRNILWQTDLASRLTTGQLTVSGVIVGNVEIAVVGRHHVTRHHFLLRYVSATDEP